LMKVVTRWCVCARLIWLGVAKTSENDDSRMTFRHV
jgi:hypothetical protein